MKDMDYVVMYAKKLKEDNALFRQQKLLLESQLSASRSLFQNEFGKDNFEKNARVYLAKIGLL